MERRFQGHSDVPLDDVGIAQAEAAAPVLAGLNPTKIISSDLIRTRDTAQTLAVRTGLEIEFDPRLRETNAGTWEGLTRDEIEAVQPGALAAWAAGSNLKPGGGETRSDVAGRMVEVIETQLAQIPDQGLLVVVTHGGAARAAIGSMLQLPVSLWGIFGVLSNCAWCVLAEMQGLGDRTADLTSAPSAAFPDVPKPLPWRLIEYNAQSLPTPALSDDR